MTRGKVLDNDDEFSGSREWMADIQGHRQGRCRSETPAGSLTC